MNYSQTPPIKEKEKTLNLAIFNVIMSKCLLKDICPRGSAPIDMFSMTEFDPRGGNSIFHSEIRKCLNYPIGEGGGHRGPKLEEHTIYIQ